MPDKPMAFDPPKPMLVWDDDDANDPESGAPYLAEVFYVNPGLGAKRVFAHGDGMAARNMGATWDHCAETAVRAVKAVYDYLSDTKDDAKTATDEDEPSIVTYLELQKWVANGNGQVLVRCKDEISYTPVYSNTVTYPEGKDNETVPWVRTANFGECYIMVRKYGDKEPANPTREYMGVPDPGYSSVAVPD